MSISHYIKEIGRGKHGARALSREQAQDLFGQVLDRSVTDLEIGAFCLAMRIKAETTEEMLGFLDATRQRTHLIGASDGGRATVVIPSYNGARKAPALTPLLALLLVRAGCRVVVHGVSEDPARTTSAQVLAALGIGALTDVTQVKDDVLNYLPIEVLSPALAQLLAVRRVVGLRNSAHSLVKLMNPCAGPALVIGSYTHAEYLVSMDAVYLAAGADALLLRGIDGEAVADGRRFQHIDAYHAGEKHNLQLAQTGPISALPDWPADLGAAATAAYIQQVLSGTQPVPAPIAAQVGHVLQWFSRIPGLGRVTV
ncbi:DNA-binding protein YbiB [Lampropedia aestuarii]|uniref:DNA-binding protein YbiB n=1 Tax=Lampropedia aestuarii TaxID=2562762 RepID=A0A4S5BUV8_9BURK|nr:DNA-binding protein YbiB [Lampropedia aestuarii]MDH5858102.1 DNA-binding protein YbiB [Lampropedia aestuarii]THJ33738.1 DNA-binding protein YbiB [Lampropedia aestuarii]